MAASRVLLEPTISSPGLGRVSAARDTLVIREWSNSEQSYPHAHRSDDEAGRFWKDASASDSSTARWTPLPAPRFSSRLGWLIPKGS